MRPLDHLLRLRGFVVALCLLCLLSMAHAAGNVAPTGTTNQTEWYFHGTTAAWNAGYPGFSTKQAACTFWRDTYVYQPKGGSWNGATHSGGAFSYADQCSVAGAVCTRNGTSCGTDSFSEGVTTRNATVATCPANATASGADCNCNAGYGPNEAGTACVIGCSASAGTTREVNFTLGWTRTANAADYGFVGGQASIPTSVCHAGCTVGVLTAQRTWVSPSPSPNGLYRHSADLLVVGTDSSCSAPSASVDPTTGDADCDGTVGYINGKRTCVKGSSSPDPVAPAPAAEITGNPAAGSEPNPTDASNPAGREPTGGTGGNAGGPPSGAAAGLPRGDGSGPTTGGAGGGQTIKVEIPDLKDPCGIPGSPPCKIDETGTPDGEGAFGAAGDGLDDARDELLGLIEGIKANEGPPAWTWTFALPTGCSPIPVGGFAPVLDPIDICEFQPLFHDLMSVAWLLGTVGGCVTLLYRTLVGSD